MCDSLLTLLCAQTAVGPCKSTRLTHACGTYIVRSGTVHAPL